MTDHRVPPDRFASLAAHGLTVMPLIPREKRPANGWAKYQTEEPTPADLARWDSSDYNVGIVTGKPGGIVVLDVDNEEAQHFADQLDLPSTPTVRTGRGRHYYFRAPPREVRNAVGVAELKLDIRGTGGYVVAAGSIHPNGLAYEWVTSPEEIDFAPLPDAILALIEPAKKPNRVEPTRSCESAVPAAASDFTVPSGMGTFLDRKLDEALSELTKCTVGERNDMLFKMSARLARHVAAAKHSWVPFADALGDCARSIGLLDGEIGATIASGWEAGSAQPTPWILTATEYVYLSAQTSFYHLESGKDLKRDGFDGQHGHLYHGKGLLSTFLLKQGLIRKVYDLSYEPLESRRFIERNGLTYLNTFRPSHVVAVPGDATPFGEFFEGLVPDPTERTHLLKMMAFTVRNPGKKLRHALLLRTAKQGVGKSMLMDIWSALVGRHNVKKPTSDEISSGYQGYLTEAVLVVCEELNLGMGAKTYNALKEMVTGDTVRVNEKYMKQREWNVYATFVFLTNLERPLMIEGTDRRFYVIDSQAVKQTPDYYAEFANWWKSNLGVIRHYLDEVDLTAFNPHAAPPMTAAKVALIASSKTVVAQDLQFAIEQRHGVFDRDLVTLAQVVFHFGRKWSERELSNALTEVGAINLGQQRFGHERPSVWAIRNQVWWVDAPNSARKAEFDCTGERFFALLEKAGIEMVKLHTSPEAANLVRGFESLFGFPSPRLAD